MNPQLELTPAPAPKLDAPCRRVRDYLLFGVPLGVASPWRSLKDIAANTQPMSETSASARLRQLRGEHGYQVDCNRERSGKITHHFYRIWAK